MFSVSRRKTFAAVTKQKKKKRKRKTLDDEWINVTL